MDGCIVFSLSEFAKWFLIELLFHAERVSEKCDVPFGVGVGVSDKGRCGTCRIVHHTTALPKRYSQFALGTSRKVLNVS